MIQPGIRPLRRVTHILAARPFLRHVTLLSGGTAAAQAIAVLSMPITTRLYLPEHFGVLAVFVSILALTTPLATLNYAVTIPIAEDEDLADDVLRLCFLITIAFSLLVALALFFCSGFIRVRYPDVHLTPYLWLLPITLFGAGLYQALSNWALRNKQFKLIAGTQLSRGFSSAVTKIGLGGLGVRPLGLLMGYFLSQASGTSAIFLALLRQKPGFFNCFRWAGIYYAARRFVRFPLTRTWSNLLHAMSTSLPPLCMATFYSTQAAGLFGLAFAIIAMPMKLLGTSIGQVYYAEIAQYGKSRPDKIFRLSMAVLKKLLVVAVVPVAGIIAAGPLLFALLFGEEWREAGIYARYLAPSLLIHFATNPIGHCLDVLEMQLSRLAVNLCRVMIPIVVFSACSRLEVESQQVVLCFGVALAIFRLALAIFFLYTLRTASAGPSRTPA